MTEALKIILKHHVNKREFAILQLYDFFNKEIFNKNYFIDDITLKRLLDFFENNSDLEIFNSFWGENSIQYSILDAALILNDFFENDINSSKKSLELILLNRLTNKDIIKVVLEYFQPLKELYLFSTNDNKEQITYEDQNFRIYFLNSNRALVNDYELNNIYLYTVIKGNIYHEENIYSKRDVFYSDSRINFKSLNDEDFLIMLIVIKPLFLKNSNISINLASTTKHSIYDPNIFKLIDSLYKNKIDISEDMLLIFELVYYLIEVSNGIKFETINIDEFQYKKIISTIIIENIYLKEKDIIDLLLKNLKVSLTKLYKIFDTLYFMSPVNYVMQLRLKSICKDLATSNHSIETISLNYGFSMQRLSKLIFQEYGFTPTELRKMFKEI